MTFVFLLESTDELLRVEVKDVKCFPDAVKEMRKDHPFEKYRVINVEKRGV